MEETWKDVNGFEGLYKVSSYGKIFSIKANKILKTCVSNKGYELVCLRGFNGKRKQHTVHRIVALSFLSNPNDYPIINHKDEDKLNNCVDNLEWCSYSYNNTYGDSLSKENRTLRASNRKECWAINLITEEVKHFNSLREAASFINTNPTNLTNVINGKYKQFKNWHISLTFIDVEKFNSEEYLTKHRKTKRNTSGYVGVSYNKKTNKYRATLTVDKKYYDLGYYNTPEEASIAYNSKLKELENH